MKQSCIICFCLILIVCTVCQAQTINIKPYFIYHQSVSKQDEPVFYNIYLPIDGGTGFHYVNANSFSKGFTLATGLEYGFTIDYTFRNQLGFELGLGYFNSLVKIDEPSDLNPLSRGFIYGSDWNYHSIAVRPLFSYTVVTGKSAFIGKIGPSVHYASATRNSFYMNEKLSTCTFADRFNWGYSTGIEYNYPLLKQLSLAMELGFEQYRYTPDKATVEYEEKFAFERKKDEICYVNKVVHEPTFAYHSLPLQNKRIKESVLFNNLYFGIGIKYNLWKK